MKKVFKVPDETTRRHAIGSLSDAPSNVAAAIRAIIPLFKPIPKPGSSDWLANHNEEGQTFDDYKMYPKNMVDKKRHTIYLQPLEEQIDEDFVETLRKFTESFYYGMNVKVNPWTDVKKLGVASRKNSYTGRLQYNASQILRALEKKLPSDAYCLIGVCLTDLYPRDDWNFGKEEE